MPQFIEFENWGLNAVTIGSIGTFFFTIVQGWGLIKQLKTIKEKQSGKSVSTLLFGGFVSIYLAFGLYGYRTHSLAIMMNGMLGFLYLRIYLAAIQFPDSTGWKWWHGMFLFLIPAMVYTSHPQVLLGVVLLIAAPMLFLAPYEIFQKKSAGAVELRYLGTFTSSAFFWVIFSIGVKDWVVFTSNVAAVATMALTFWLWFKYRPKPALQTR